MLDKETAPRELELSGTTDQEEYLLIEASVHRTKRSSRHHRVDEDFLVLLEEDFGIPMFSLSRAFDGVPPAPKKEAIALCEWAILRAGGDPEEAGNALRAWARKNGAGTFDRRLVEAPPLTWEHNDYLRSIGRLTTPPDLT